MKTGVYDFDNTHQIKNAQINKDQGAATSGKTSSIITQNYFAISFRYFRERREHKLKYNLSLEFKLATEHTLCLDLMAFKIGKEYGCLIMAMME